MFKNPFSFNGRIRRMEYGLSLIICIVAFFVAGAFLGSISLEKGFHAAGLILVLPAAWFFLAQRTKRCHDRSVNGLWQFVPFYPLILLFGDGDPGENEYGQNPKGIELVDDWDPIANPNNDIVGEDGIIK